MKDFQKLNDFLAKMRSFVDFCCRAKIDTTLPEWSRKRVTECLKRDILRMKDYERDTYLQGENLANELLEVCPDMRELQTYFDMWCSRIDNAYIPGSDWWNEKTDSIYWYHRGLDSTEQYEMSVLSQQMEGNWKDLCAGRSWIKHHYGLEEEYDKMLIEENDLSTEERKNELSNGEDKEESISPKWWKDGTLETAQEKFKNEKGAKTVRAILKMVYDKDKPLPKYGSFNEKFPGTTNDTDFYRVRKEFEEPKKIDKLR